MLPPPPTWSICKARTSVHPLVPSSLCQRQSGLLQRPPSFAMISQRKFRCRIVLLLSAMCISYTPSCRASLKTSLFLTLMPMPGAATERPPNLGAARITWRSAPPCYRGQTGTGMKFRKGGEIRARPRTAARSDARRYLRRTHQPAAEGNHPCYGRDREPEARMAIVTSKDQVSRELALRLFDQATERRRKRVSARATGRPRKRGWSREDLYRRGVIDARGQG